MTASSLLLAFTPRSARKDVLIIGSNRLANARIKSCLQAGYTVHLIPSADDACNELLDSIQLYPANSLQSPLDTANFFDELVSCLRIAFVCITDTIHTRNAAHPIRSTSSINSIRENCDGLNLPLNVADRPDLSDFTFPATHQFTLTDNDTSLSSLQLAITTNSNACRLASRLKRQIVASIPREAGQAIHKIGLLRTKIKAAQEAQEEGGLEENWDLGDLNEPVKQISRCPRKSISQEGLLPLTRMKIVAQISEYWPIDRIASMSEKEMDDICQSIPPPGLLEPTESSSTPNTRHDLLLEHDSPGLTKPGSIYLLGSGPGSPSLLTLAAHDLLTRKATLILSDKLVPSEILALIPSSIPLVIAKKYPGNSEGAQDELMSLAYSAAVKGETVVRLKQGDPFVYGRGGEEVLYFRERGIECTVIPGISSAIAGPLMAGIPVTQRGVAESLVLCTGVGRKGKGVVLPGYERSRTLVVLMGVARLASVVNTLLSPQIEGENGGGRKGEAYPADCPIAIIERASSRDQRVVASTLQNIQEAMESVGDQRPPAMMVIGWSVLALQGKGDMTVLDEDVTEDGDEARVNTWLNGKKWIQKEGLSDEWVRFTDASSP